MKSIKEKSEELSTAFRKEQGDVGYSEQLSYKLGVEAGANYVLDHLSKTIAVSEDGYLLDNIKKMIEQLKK